MRLAVRTLAELGEDIVLAPERWVASSALSPSTEANGIPLEELVVERRQRADSHPKKTIVIDTTHARDGLLDIHAALRAAPEAKSSKKLALPGDLVVSRLRPYLRQIAFVHPRALESQPAKGRSLALSTEFYVLAPRSPDDDLAYLLPFLLGREAQIILAAAQEGGHHPRVPRSSLLALRVPKKIVGQRRRLSAEIRETLRSLYEATDRFQSLFR